MSEDGRWERIFLNVKYPLGVSASQPSGEKRRALRFKIGAMRQLRACGSYIRPSMFDGAREHRQGCGKKARGIDRHDIPRVIS